MPVYMLSSIIPIDTNRRRVIILTVLRPAVSKASILVNVVLGTYDSGKLLVITIINISIKCPLVVHAPFAKITGFN